MAAPNGHNFQVSGLGLRGHIWVEAAENWMTEQLFFLLLWELRYLPESTGTDIFLIVLSVCMKIHECRLFACRDRRASATCFLSLMIFYLALPFSTFLCLFAVLSFILAYFFLHSLFLSASLLSNNDSRDRSALWLTQRPI